MGRKAEASPGLWSPRGLEGYSPSDLWPVTILYLFPVNCYNPYNTPSSATN